MWSKLGYNFRSAAFRIAMLSCYDLLVITFSCPSTHTPARLRRPVRWVKAERVTGGLLVVLAAGFWLANLRPAAP